MKYLKIQNAGVLDIRLVALMGGTTKSNDDYKIGQFGTGLKYTMAFLFRNNIDFHIFAGEQEMLITLEEETIREEKFEIICINGHRTSITTKMGNDWKAWMIIRELWSNALDEGQSFREVTQDVRGEEGKTTFFIQVDSQIDDVLKNWQKYFIHGIKPMSETSTHKIYPGGPTLRLYKNGILIHEEENTPSLFSYDIMNARLNELREYKGYMGSDICNALFGANEETATYFLENVNEDLYEGGDLTYDWYTKPWGASYEKILDGVKLIHQKALNALIESGAEIRPGSYVVVPEGLFKSLSKQFERVSALRVCSMVGEFYESYDAQTEGRIKQGLTILEACDYPVHPELTFVYGYFADKKVMARVNLDEKKIYLSNTLLQAPLNTIVAILIEEVEHFNTGFRDCSREFQQHFINLYTRQLLGAHEIEI